MQELKCPECGHLNPDIRELGYTLPWTCGKCPHIWRLQDVMTQQDRDDAVERLKKRFSGDPEFAQSLLPGWTAEDLARAFGSSEPPNVGANLRAEGPSS